MPKDESGARISANNVKRLNEAMGLLKQATELLAKIEAGWSVPDAPERPPAMQTLKALSAEGTRVSTISKRLLTTMGS